MVSYFQLPTKDDCCSRDIYKGWWELMRWMLLPSFWIPCKEFCKLFRRASVRAESFLHFDARVGFYEDESLFFLAYHTDFFSFDLTTPFFWVSGTLSSFSLSATITHNCFFLTKILPSIVEEDTTEEQTIQKWWENALLFFTFSLQLVWKLKRWIIYMTTGPLGILPCCPKRTIHTEWTTALDHNTWLTV